MTKFVKKKCEDCNCECNRLYIRRGKMLCGHCFRSKLSIINPIPNTLFDEPINKLVRIDFNLTAKQKDKMDKRIKSVYGSLRGKKSAYLRELVLHDLLNWEEKNDQTK